MGSQTREAVVPEAVVVRDPFAHGSQPMRNKAVPSFTTVALLGHQTGIEQHAQVLRHRRPAHFEMPGDAVHGSIGLGEQIENAPACRMADGLKHPLLAIPRGDHAGEYM